MLADSTIPTLLCRGPSKQCCGKILVVDCGSQDRSVSDFVVAAAQEAAQKTITEIEVLRLCLGFRRRGGPRREPLA